MLAPRASLSHAAAVPLCLALLFAGGTLSLAALAEDPAAVEFLTKKGLAKKGTVWMCPEEVKVAEGLASLKVLERAYKEIRIKVDTELKANSSARTALTQVRVEYEKFKQVAETLQANGQTGSPQHSLAVAEANKRADLINTYLPKVVDLDSPHENPAFKKTFKEMIEARNKLILALLGIRNHVDGLDACYAEIKSDTDVADALKLLGPPHKLGPAKNYTRELKPVELAEKTVLANDTPIYRDNRTLQLSLIMNETTPVTLGYTDQLDFSALTFSTAKTLGIAAKEKDPEVTLNAAEGKKFVGREITIPSLRIGKHVIKDVKMILLPEDADVTGLPTVLCPKAFEGLNFEVVRDEFKFVIKPPANEPVNVKKRTK